MPGRERSPRFVACFVLTAVFAGHPALAVTPEMPFELTPYVGFRLGGALQDDASSAEVEIDNTETVGIIFNLREGLNTQWEVAYAYQPGQIEIDFLPPGASPSVISADGTDIDIHHLQFGGTYIGEGTWSRPYMAATVGLAHIDPDFSAFDSDTYFAFTIGGGLKFFPTERIGVRLEARMYGTVIDSKSNIFCTSGTGGANCLFEVQGDVLWQFDATLGATFRF